MQTFLTIIPDSDNRKVTETIVSKIELKEDVLVCQEDYYADYKDEDLGTTKNELRKTTHYQLKSEIAGCSKHWYCVTKVWGVEVNMRGVTDNIIPVFKRESQAQEFVDALMGWLKK